MKVIIVGAGEVGRNIARHLLEEDQDVVVIDNNGDKLRTLVDQLDVQTVEGHGAHPDIIQAAGGDQADMIIAVTRSDEVNMVACQIAYSLFNVPTKIARVREPSYLSVTRQQLYNRANMPVDVIISPEVEVAASIVRSMSVPGAFDAEDFADGRARVIAARVTADAPIMEKSVYEVDKENLRIMAIYRNDRLIFPTAEDHVEKGDEIYFVCPRESSQSVMHLMGYGEQVPKNIFVYGGGNIGLNICRRLEKQGITPRVLELDKERAEGLADTLTNTTVLHGDALDREILNQENISAMDVVLAVTQDDATNILASVQSRELNSNAHIVTLINKTGFVPLVKGMGLEHVISPGEITASRILRHLRRCNVHMLHTVKDGEAEIMEAQVSAESNLIGMHALSLPLPTGVSLGAIVTAQAVVLPTSETVVHEGDRLILFCDVDSVHQAEALF